MALASRLEPLRRLAARIRPPALPRRVCEVGWLLTQANGSLVYDTPRALTRNDIKPKHAKSASYCPAVLDFESRHYEVPCPFDLEIGLQPDEKGVIRLTDLAGDKSTVRGKHFQQMMSPVSRKEWRHPDRPMLQIITPYVFLADEPVWMSQIPPFEHYRENALPGILVAGRMPIHIWPRPMMWAFEWFEPKKPIVLKRGEPWFYLRFETQDPTRPVRLVEATLTPEVDEYIKGLSGVTNYVQRTYSLFDTAKERRPKQLVVKKVR